MSISFITERIEARGTTFIQSVTSVRACFRVYTFDSFLFVFNRLNTSFRRISPQPEYSGRGASRNNYDETVRKDVLTHGNPDVRK